MPDRLDTEDALASVILETLTVGLVSNLIILTEPLVQNDNGDGTYDGEGGND